MNKEIYSVNIHPFAKDSTLFFASGNLDEADKALKWLIRDLKKKGYEIVWHINPKRITHGYDFTESVMLMDEDWEQLDVTLDNCCSIEERDTDILYYTGSAAVKITRERAENIINNKFNPENYKDGKIQQQCSDAAA